MVTVKYHSRTDDIRVMNRGMLLAVVEPQGVGKAVCPVCLKILDWDEAVLHLKRCYTAQQHAERGT